MLAALLLLPGAQAAEAAMGAGCRETGGDTFEESFADGAYRAEGRDDRGAECDESVLTIRDPAAGSATAFSSRSAASSDMRYEGNGTGCTSSDFHTCSDGRRSANGTKTSHSDDSDVDADVAGTRVRGGARPCERSSVTTTRDQETRTAGRYARETTWTTTREDRCATGLFVGDDGIFLADCTTRSREDGVYTSDRRDGSRFADARTEREEQTCAGHVDAGGRSIVVGRCTGRTDSASHATEAGTSSSATSHRACREGLDGSETPVRAEVERTTDSTCTDGLCMMSVVHARLHVGAAGREVVVPLL